MRRRSDKLQFKLQIILGFLAIFVSCYAVYSMARFNTFIDRANESIRAARGFSVNQ